MVRRLRFSGPKTSIICTPMTSLKTSIKTITYLSDTGCLEIQGASLLTESLFRTLAQEVLGTTKVTYGEHVFDFGKPFEKLTMREAIKKYRPETDMADLDNFDAAKALAESIGITVEKSWGLGRIVTEIFDEVAEAHLIQPTFITEYPAEVSPLARRNDVNPEITDRFEFFIGGREIGNGFSELNDAEDQAERFQEQVNAKAAGDDEAMFYDEDYVTATGIWSCRQPLVWVLVSTE
ncbi:lysyl-tRNA synthetase domain protein [Shigella dysenteriae 155-74]|nr:lysyl-tRNA synthetase domain protein [Shigella dysenteriae 155-74]